MSGALGVVLRQQTERARGCAMDPGRVLSEEDGFAVLALADRAEALFNALVALRSVCCERDLARAFPRYHDAPARRDERIKRAEEAYEAVLKMSETACR